MSLSTADKMSALFTERPKSLKVGQIVFVPDRNPSIVNEFVIDGIYDHGNLLSDCVLVLCHRSGIENEWLLTDCHFEFGSPVLSKIQKLTCPGNISHFVKKRQSENYEKFRLQFLRSGN